MKSIIVFGNGARELAIVRSLLRAETPPKVYNYCECAANPGISSLIGDSNIYISSYSALNVIKEFILKHMIEVAIIGPEGPLANGLADFLGEYMKVIGPTRNLARIESSKRWARNFIRGVGLGVYNPDYVYISNYTSRKVDIEGFIKRFDGRVAIKLDGLRGGKGVSVWGRDFNDVAGALSICNSYKDIGANFVVEECLEGVEFSLISISDGISSVGLPPVVDFKPLYDGNTGPNTGSMGSILDKDGCHFLSDEVIEEAVRVNETVLEELKFTTGESYVGFLYGSFMLTKRGLKVIEFNCRLGDPEGVLLLEGMKTSLTNVCEWIVGTKLEIMKHNITYHPKSLLCKYIVPTGYPEQRVRGLKIDVNFSYPPNDKYELLPASVTNKVPGIYKTLGSRSLLVLGETTTGLNELEADMNVWLKGINHKDVHYRTDLTKLYSDMNISTVSNSVYKDSGVDIDLVSETLRECTTMIERTHTSEVVHNRGGFGGLYAINPLLEYDLTHPILVSSTDGVGTKTEFVYQRIGKTGFQGIGMDLVNHCINDILVQGASPLYFVDYFASSKFDPEVFKYFIMGVTKACADADCSVIGGETAEMPGIYTSGSHDVVGTITGLVDGERLINGRRDISLGDYVIALPSNGLHTNGFSLIRKIYEGVELEESYVNALVGYHRSYLNEIRELFDRKVRIHGLCHITGGGLVDNPPRVLPDGLEITYNSEWKIPEMYRRIQRDAGLSEIELKKVFNCGVGMMIFIAPIDYKWVSGILEDSFFLGSVTAKSTTEV